MSNNDPDNNDITPLEPAELDELLSAELDGELDGAARDLGMDVDGAEARIRSTPGAHARRAALVRARDLLSEQPEIDELVDQRLRAKALRAAAADQANRADEHRDRRNRVLLSASGIAAAIVVALAIAAGISHSHSSDAKSSANADERIATAAPREAAPPTAYSGAARQLGNFTSVRTLAQKAVAQARAEQSRLQSKPSPSFGGPVAHGPSTPTPTTRAVKQSGTGAGAPVDLKNTDATGGTVTVNAPSVAQSQEFKTAIASCSAGRLKPAGGVLTLRATAVLSGRPFLVLVYASGGNHVVLVFDGACKLFNRQTLP